MCQLGECYVIEWAPVKPPGLNGESGIGVIVGESLGTSVYNGCCHGQSLYTVCLYSHISVSSFGTTTVQRNPQYNLVIGGDLRDLLDTDVCQLGECNVI